MQLIIKPLKSILVKEHAYRSQSDVLSNLEDVKLINTQESDNIYKENWVKVRSGSIFGLSHIGDNCNCKGDSEYSCIFVQKP